MHLQMYVSVQHLSASPRLPRHSSSMASRKMPETGDRRPESTASPGSFMAAAGGGEQTRLTLTHHAAPEGRLLLELSLAYLLRLPRRRLRLPRRRLRLPRRRLRLPRRRRVFPQALDSGSDSSLLVLQKCAEAQGSGSASGHPCEWSASGQPCEWSASGHPCEWSASGQPTAPARLRACWSAVRS